MKKMTGISSLIIFLTVCVFPTFFSTYVYPSADKPLNFAESITAGQTLKTNRQHQLSPVGGTPPYTFSSSSSQLVLMGKPVSYMVAFQAGTYSVTLKDSKGATITKQFVFVLDEKVQGLKLSLSAETVTVGETVTLSITGGTPPYRITRAPNVKSAATGHATFVLTGESASGGPVTIDVKDSKGAGGWTSLTVKPAILTVTIVSKKIHVGDTTTMKVIGGTPPYTVTDSKAILTIQAKGQADFELKGVKAGTAHIEVRDNRNRPKFDYVTVIENVSPLSVSFTTKELKVRDYAFLKISGGSPDYTVTSSSPVVSISWLSPIEYKLVALKAGSATVTVKDSKGLTKTSLITVKETTAPLSISLTSKEIKVGESATLTISGGHPWYGVKVDSTILLLSMESPSSYKLKALKAGISTITVTDARGETKTFSLTVKK